MANTDYAEVDAFLHTQQPQVPIFADTRLQYANDIQQGNYSGGQVQFDMLQAKNSWVSWDSSYLVVPIAVSSSTAMPYTSSTIVFPKDGGLAGIFSGIQVADEASTWLAETSGQTPIVNAVRAMIEGSPDWLASEAPTQCYAATPCDYVASDAQAALASANPSTALVGVNMSPFVGAPGSAVDLGPTTSSTIKNPQYQKGADDAQRAFLQQCPFNAATQSFAGNVVIPVRSLHNVFSSLDMPLRQLHLKLTLYFNNPSWQPFVCTNGSAPKLTIGAAAMTGVANLPVVLQLDRAQPGARGQAQRQDEGGHEAHHPIHAHGLLRPQPVQQHLDRAVHRHQPERGGASARVAVCSCGGQHGGLHSVVAHQHGSKLELPERADQLEQLPQPAHPVRAPGVRAGPEHPCRRVASHRRWAEVSTTRATSRTAASA